GQGRLRPLQGPALESTSRPGRAGFARRLTPASLDRRRASSRPGAAIRQSHTHLGACKPRRSNDRLLMRLLRISRAPTDQLDRNRDKGSAMRFAKFLLLTCSAMAPVSALAEEDVA